MTAALPPEAAGKPVEYGSPMKPVSGSRGH